MDRRGFFKRFGALTAAPFLPFHWNATDNKKPVMVDEVEPEVSPDAPHPHLTPTRLFINNVELTNVCQDLSIDYEREFVDFTHLESTKGYREFHPGAPKTRLKTRLCCEPPKWLSLDNERPYKVKVYLDNKTIYYGDMILMDMDYNVNVECFPQLNLDFLFTGPITVRMRS